MSTYAQKRTSRIIKNFLPKPVKGGSLLGNITSTRLPHSYNVAKKERILKHYLAKPVLSKTRDESMQLGIPTVERSVNASRKLSARAGQKNIKGTGLLNAAINNLPVPLHVPGYNYLGPGTPHLLYEEKGIKPKNPLDAAAFEHDKAYGESKNLKDRHIADYKLQEDAWKRVISKDAGIGEKTFAWLTTNAMKVKRAVGAGLNKSKASTSPYVKTKVNLDAKDIKRIETAIQKGKALQVTVKHKRTKESITLGTLYLPLTRHQAKKVASATTNVPIKITSKQLRYLGSANKTGGFLPMLAAALPAVAAIGSLIANTKRTIDNKKANDQLIAEKKRHNLAMEGRGVGKRKRRKNKGKGIYLNKKPKKGEGLKKKKRSVNRRSNGNILMKALKKKKTLCLT